MTKERGGITKSEFDSLLQWWDIAGVDLDYATDAKAWLDADISDKAPAAAKEVCAPTLAKKSEIKNAREAALGNSVAQLPKAPDSYEKFLEFWMKETTLALPSGSGKRIAPHGPMKAQLMIISDMPDPDDLQKLFSGSAGILLNHILNSSQIATDSLYYASLLPEHSVEMSLDRSLLSGFGKILSKHIGFVEPESIVLLGNMPNSALTENDLANNRTNLQYINHDFGKIPATSSFHPRSLLQRPGMKAKAWQDWQRYMESIKL